MQTSLAFCIESSNSVILIDSLLLRQILVVSKRTLRRILLRTDLVNDFLLVSEVEKWGAWECST